MIGSVLFPTPVQICLDDVAWHNGADLRCIGQPSRSGIPRKHAPEDYEILNEIGKAIDMKILCPLVIGEWDKDNYLKNKPGYTYDPKGWDRKNEIDYKTAEECLEMAESGEYIEYALHGVLHGRYDENGKQLTEREYFDVKKNEDGTLSFFCLSEDEVNERIDTFYHIYNSWGFKKKIRSFVAPCGVPNDMPFENLKGYADVFRKRGFLYWPHAAMGMDRAAYLLGDVLLLRKNGCSDDYAPWNVYDIDPMMLYDYSSHLFHQKKSIYGLHMTNFIRYNPKNNMENLDAWVKYFRRQSEIFGLMISKDIAFCANQTLYANHSSISLERDRCIIDTSETDSLIYSGKRDEFYVSFKNHLLPKECIGADMTQYECKRNFRTYKFTNHQSTVQVLF